MAQIRCIECHAPFGHDHKNDCSILAAESYKGFQVVSEQCEVGAISENENTEAEAPPSRPSELSLHLSDRLNFEDKL